jgi:hypothetical protein
MDALARGHVRNGALYIMVEALHWSISCVYGLGVLFVRWLRRLSYAPLYHKCPTERRFWCFMFLLFSDDVLIKYQLAEFYRAFDRFAQPKEHKQS